jgi:hypothetical protein
MVNKFKAVVFLIIASVAIAACTTIQREKSQKITSCDKPKIEAAMQSLYDKSAVIDKIGTLIDHTKFDADCEGQFEAISPYKIFLYPDTLKMTWKVNYTINRSIGVCIRRAAYPESAGVYKTCYPNNFKEGALKWQAQN